MISQEIETMCPIGWSKGHVILKFMAIVIPLVKFDICSLQTNLAEKKNGISNVALDESKDQVSYT